MPLNLLPQQLTLLLILLGAFILLLTERIRIDLTAVLIILTLAVTMLPVGRLLLPDRQSGDDGFDRFRLDGYYTEIVVLIGSPFVGQTIDEIEADDNYHLRVVSWLRHGRPRNRPFSDKRLREGDILLVRTTPDDIAAIQEERGLALHQSPEPFIVTVAMATVASFFTPIGHHGNLLVYGPGRYQFSDFLRVGTPLTFLVALVVILIAPLLWPG